MPDLVLGGPGVHLERIGVAMRELMRALFRDQRPEHNLVRFKLRAAGAWCSGSHRRDPMPSFIDAGVTSLPPERPSSAIRRAPLWSRAGVSASRLYTR